MSASRTKKNGRKSDTYETTVMLRITSEFTKRLDAAADALATKEREFGRARKVGRATVVYEAMVLGLPLLEAKCAKEDAHVGADAE